MEALDTRNSPAVASSNSVCMMYFLERPCTLILRPWAKFSKAKLSFLIGLTGMEALVQRGEGGRFLYFTVVDTLSVLGFTRWDISG